MGAAWGRYLARHQTVRPPSSTIASPPPCGEGLGVGAAWGIYLARHSMRRTENVINFRCHTFLRPDSNAARAAQSPVARKAFTLPNAKRGPPPRAGLALSLRVSIRHTGKQSRCNEQSPSSRCSAKRQRPARPQSSPLSHAKSPPLPRVGRGRVGARVSSCRHVSPWQTVTNHPAQFLKKS